MTVDAVADFLARLEADLPIDLGGGVRAAWHRWAPTDSEVLLLWLPGPWTHVLVAFDRPTAESIRPRYPVHELIARERLTIRPEVSLPGVRCARGWIWEGWWVGISDQSPARGAP